VVIDQLPEPLTPPTCDLRDFAYMPLDVVRLRDSDLAATPDGEVFRAAILSWCTAWHQVPAASLPDDDPVLARLLGYGRDVKGWTKLRAAGALKGFVKCSDGRLYHPVVAEKAVTAWEAKQAQRNRTKKARDARLSQGKERSVTGDVTGSKGEGEGELKGEGQEQSSGGGDNDLFGDLPKPEPVLTKAEIIDLAFTAYDQAAGRLGWGECQARTETRRQKLGKRLDDAGGLDGWRSALEKCEASTFLMGRAPPQHDRAPFKLDIDFLLQQSSFVKLMEGKYDNREVSKAGSAGGGYLAAAARVAARRLTAGTD
jgi:hypothetical protein